MDEIQSHHKNISSDLLFRNFFSKNARCIFMYFTQIEIWTVSCVKKDADQFYAISFTKFVLIALEIKIFCQNSWPYTAMDRSCLPSLNKY